MTKNNQSTTSKKEEEEEESLDIAAAVDTTRPTRISVVVTWIDE